MYVYHEYFDAKHVALIYPGTNTTKLSGIYLDPITSKEINKECNVISLGVET